MRSYQRPGAEDALLARFPARKIGGQSEARLNLDAESGVVLKLEFDAVVTGIGGEFNIFENLAFAFGKVRPDCFIQVGGPFRFFDSHRLPVFRVGLLSLLAGSNFGSARIMPHSTLIRSWCFCSCSR